jgi:hypothetical protein
MPAELVRDEEEKQDPFPPDSPRTKTRCVERISRGLKLPGVPDRVLGTTVFRPSEIPTGTRFG